MTTKKASSSNKFQTFLQRKDIVFSFHRYGIEAMTALTYGLFASLLIGTILVTFGDNIGITWFSEFGKIAISMMGPAIAVAIAFALKAPPLVMFASTVVGAAAVQFGGGPAGCFVAAICDAEIGKMISRETKIDILVTPLVTILAGAIVAKFIGLPIGNFMQWLGNIILWATDLHPILMGCIISVVMGLILTSPLSSAAISIMLGLSGFAAGAATIGCACQMIGFAVSSYRENKIGGLIAIGIGTAKLQIPNILRHPLILIPPTLASAILGPIAIIVFQMENNPVGAGMGTSGLVGQIMTITTMGGSFSVYAKILLLHFILPTLIVLICSEFMRKKGWIKFGDQKLDL